MKLKLKQSQHGFLIIVAIVLIMIFAIIGVFITYVVNSDMLSTTNQLGGQKALYIAEAGLESGTHQLMIPTIASRIACTDVTSNVNLTNFTFTGAAGPFTVTGAGPQSPATPSTLSTAITASTTTIPVASAAAYATTGRVMIDRELIDYVTISGNNFVNVTRGAGGTTAVAHASGAAVGQYQCMLQSQGGVPTLSPAGSVIGGGGSTIQAAVQLPEAWAVGNAVSNDVHVLHWNKPTELQWSDSNVSSLNRSMNAVFALSYADAWAVGESGLFLHWNGNSWSAVSSGDSSNYFGVHCVANNYCWAVGGARSFNVWNGSNWTEQTSTVSTLPNVSYNSVYCNSTTDCWAVGNAIGNDLMVHWDGINWTRNLSTPSPVKHLNSVWCTASTNCWAVGDDRAFIRWNNTAWVAQSTTGLPNVNYNGVTCINNNDCWAVGNRASGASVTVHWNGSAWSRVTASGNVNLYGVSCSKTDSCWAVGASGTTLHWNGSAWVTISNPLNVKLNGVSALGAAIQPESAWQEQFP
ncbi:MAG: hypothetical protein A3I77_02425 [Gammaproteobacteria bacterium RIFCSPLOWO2_02_FULL_42_14]|nr:MAG: hypothetical protein A3B71_02265 [Gammaproteobacteria bacterium RIFCSPHIGHO2_02_FULL_42_43]OGT53509.1 MAG: hypothetical protein A3E54_02290 [Gammaproteobacteria bacterium RIFCSPHIGHO2_12_FULL_41_25]OGT61455.1 MAG: hypothetical protein A3I77_02425 [Gammaproteobacteria bacterium RIFCSPLOWO2_02_FULL_42_14]OGT86481.1 MAG: hypothetical protein A3G86_02490 [Gammaproteobacteria bacterium RIFCSPLOWO2_12_FULL_42_18]